MDVVRSRGAVAGGRDRPLWTIVSPLALLTLLVVAMAIPAAAASSPSPVQAPSAIMIDRVTGRTLYGKDIHHRRPMASTTKIMTALLVVERCRRLSMTVKAPAAVASSSGIDLIPGERITIKEALLAMMVHSANDAGITLATAVAGNETAFVGLMNAKARTLGLRDTHFDNATGSMRDAGHYSSVYDLARLARYAMRDARFRDLVRRRDAVIRWGSGRQRVVHSNNLLLYFDWADGVKCGVTTVAGYCLVGSGQPGLRPLITATLGGASRDQDARDHVGLYQWGSSLFERKTLVTRGDAVAAEPLAGSGYVQVAALRTLSAVVRSAAQVRRTLTLPQGFTTAPAAGTVVGTATYFADGVRLGSVRLVVVSPPPPA